MIENTVALDEKAPRQWSRTAQTRTAIREAARAEFVAHGYADASIAGVVARSGCSVGSIYHHFGGKAELFLALWETHQRDYSEAANAAVTARRRAGESDPLELFVAGARAYLEMAWTNRELARLFLAGDGPPGFDALQRTLGRTWIRQNSALLRAADDPVGRVQVMVLTSIVGDGAREVSSLESRRDVRQLIDLTLSFVRKIAT